jgi:hypothetical protein
MHNPAVPKPLATALFERLRRASVLRVLVVIATLLASQGSLACVIEDVFSGADMALGADLDVSSSTDQAGDECCTLCFDCAHCGGCHGSAVSPRLGQVNPGVQANVCAKITFATAAPSHWTPPALLRPPIDAA